MIEPAFDHELIAKFGSAAIVDLSAYDHGISLVLVHPRETETEFFSEQGPRDLDEAQIGNIGDNASAIGIEEHHLHFRADARRGCGDHAQQ